ncbi:hypothetical protein [Marilutibacter maris]|uniref:Membrane protein n=1 Tax=Marilutibacter maris TaxID=1605891 RepID=A0A2U9T3E4_9GAMM|nr:hypothetical protein [Lysobacter maris]AWV07206.1 membrane protein [Lysobacter maris]KAB8198192.1 hypothetical protein FKV24_003360 [Lysobacter maris]
MILFFALVSLSLAIAGATAFVIFWPLALVHIRDRHPGVLAEFGPGAFINPAALGWLLAKRYAAIGDRNLSGLATPARLSLLTIIGGLLMAGALWLLSQAIA